MKAEPLGNTNVTTITFALAEDNRGKWAAIFEAANDTDPRIKNERFESEWFDTQEEAEAKLSEVITGMMKLGLKAEPMKRPA